MSCGVPAVFPGVPRAFPVVFPLTAASAAVQSPQPQSPRRAQLRRRAAPIEEAVIVTAPKPASWTHSEEYVAEDEVLANARARAEEVGVVPIGAGAGAALRFLASVLDARAVVEIGTGTGVSGLWMLRGMRPDGVLTSVDTEAEHQRLAQGDLHRGGDPTAAGPADPRRRARGAAPAHRRPLRPGVRRRRQAGVPRVPRRGPRDCCGPAAWWPSTTPCGTTGWPTPPSATRTRPRSASSAASIREDDTLVPVLLPVGDGLLLREEGLGPRGLTAPDAGTGRTAPG